jgi:hypothetical protein
LKKVLAAKREPSLCKSYIFPLVKVGTNLYKEIDGVVRISGLARWDREIASEDNEILRRDRADD